MSVSDLPLQLFSHITPVVEPVHEDTGAGMTMRQDERERTSDAGLGAPLGSGYLEDDRRQVDREHRDPVVEEVAVRESLSKPSHTPALGAGQATYAPPQAEHVPVPEIRIEEPESEDDATDVFDPNAAHNISTTRTNEEVFELIQDGIEYARECALNGQNPLTCRRFEIPLAVSLSEVIQTLRDAARERLVDLIWSMPHRECYEVGFRPPPVYGYPYATIADPHWWVGKSEAHIKAGPMADKKDIREAEGVVRRREERRVAAGSKSRRASQIEDKLAEGLRRQTEGLPMCDSDSDSDGED
jgi:hypothetical protein